MNNLVNSDKNKVASKNNDATDRLFTYQREQFERSRKISNVGGMFFLFLATASLLFYVRTNYFIYLITTFAFIVATIILRLIYGKDGYAERELKRIEDLQKDILDKSK